MKKYFIAAAVGLLFPFFAFASFDTNLHYGSIGQDVTALQEFLTQQGVYSGPISGNFYSLTLAGVRAFQKAEGIVPVSGYFGPITRSAVNQILAMQAPNSEGNATTTKPIVDLSQQSQPTQTSPTQTPQVSSVTVPNTQPQTTTEPQQTQNTVTQTTSTNSTSSNTTKTTPVGTTTVSFSSSQDMPPPSIIAYPSIPYTFFGTVEIDNSTSDQEVHISRIPLELSVSGGGVPTDLKYCQLSNAGMAVNTGARIMNPTASGEITFSLDSYAVPWGVIGQLSLYCTVECTAPKGATYTWSMNSNDSSLLGWAAYNGDPSPYNIPPTLNFEPSSGVSYQEQ